MRSTQKNGERTVPIDSGAVCHLSRCISAPGLCANGGFTLWLVLPVENASKGCSSDSSHARLSGQYPRFGSRRIRVFLGREGLEVGKERCSRLWREAGMQVPAKRKRRRIASSQPRLCLLTGKNSVWSYECVYDACAKGQTLKCLTVVDGLCRQVCTVQPNCQTTPSRMQVLRVRRGAVRRWDRSMWE